MTCFSINVKEKEKKVIVEIYDVDYPSEVKEGETVTVEFSMKIVSAENVSYPVDIPVCLYRKDGNLARKITCKTIKYYGAVGERVTLSFTAPKSGTYEFALVPSTEFDGLAWDDDFMCRNTYTILFD